MRMCAQQSFSGVGVLQLSLSLSQKRSYSRYLYLTAYRPARYISGIGKSLFISEPRNKLQVSRPTETLLDLPPTQLGGVDRPQGGKFELGDLQRKRSHRSLS